jgi:hypothetical protein
MHQRDVASVLRTLGVPLELEYCPPGSFFSIDIARE